MSDLPELLSTAEAGQLVRKSRLAMIDLCKRNAGFGFRIGRTWRIPRAHLERVMRGEPVEQISAEVRRGSSVEVA